MELPEGKKLYFASDFHLGVPNKLASREREKRIISWLDSIEHDAHTIYIVGDIFDFWFEYKHAIPKGFVRFQAKIASMTDKGIKIHFFTGNHDMWMFDYFAEELGIEMHRKPIEPIWNDKQFYIGHGDGLGPGDNGYKFLKKVFEARWSQWCFARLHPNFGIGLANYFSRKSRLSTGKSDEVFLGDENEWLAVYSKEYLATKHVDYFVFGHRHLPLEIQLKDNSVYYNLGEWINHFTYLEFDGESVLLKKHNESH